jgi:hypothetical protein
MRRFARSQQLAVQAVEISAPPDQLGYTQRPFFHENLGGRTEDKAVAGGHGVFKVKGDVLLAFGGDCDAALRVVSVRFAEGLFRDDQNFALIGKRDRRTKARYARSYDEIIYVFRHKHNL